MTPPVETFPVQELRQRVLGNAKGGWRKGFDGDLRKCELLEMLQYQCKVDDKTRRDGLVRCWPIERLFRRCKDRAGSFMVETTAWESGKKEGS